MPRALLAEAVSCAEPELPNLVSRSELPNMVPVRCSELEFLPAWSRAESHAIGESGIAEAGSSADLEWRPYLYPSSVSL